MRSIICWNEGWTFTKNEITSAVDLPHTWNAEDGQTGPEQYFRGECLYTKTFKKPGTADRDRIYVEFRGVNSSAKVWLNGMKLAEHDGGYSTFRVDLTEYLQESNELKVYVDNSANDRVYPQRADFTFYGGIYRDVYLITVSESHFDLDYFGSSGLRITPHIEGDTAAIDFMTYSVGFAEEIRVTVAETGDQLSLALSNENGKLVGSGSIIIPNVHLWNGLEDPYLYHVKAELIRNSEIVDCVEDRFGCRTYYVDPEKGFFLNGRSYPLHGVSRHQDRLGVGNALTKEMHREDMELILSMGANSIRLAHYQHDQYFYDLCDEKGIIAWAEIPYITVHMEGGRANTLSQMTELIAQNYNHASIICWALSNEITLQGVTDDLIENHRILNNLVHRMDPKRLSAMANLFLLETDSPLITLPDIRGYNLYYGWYVGEVEDNDQWFDNFHAAYPNVAIGLTEYGADSNISLQSPKPVKGDFTESYQALYHEHMLEMFSTRPYIWGTYCWNMFEFAAAGRDEAGDPGKNHKGLITFDRKQKKDAYYIYKAWWSKESFVHLCGRRYHDRIEDETEIKVYSNLPCVSLYMDDVLLETQNGSHIFKFRVSIKGIHKIKAIAENCMDEMEIEKVDTVNTEYFADPTNARNWFDEKTDVFDRSGYLSVNSTMAEIGATEAGKAFLDNLMNRMQASAAGGMGMNVEVNPAVQAMIARQPLKKLIAQGGIKLSEEELAGINRMLNQIPNA
ncbi:MAG: glycoside hydrolase family 2 TIM barrel-domain containing protein [Eubacteriales bacterium]|nr:glycoside hydrolase family 2 TIM barrel-domain containing protein [Eubacteriales bacterium]